MSGATFTAVISILLGLAVTATLAYRKQEKWAEAASLMELKKRAGRLALFSLVASFVAVLAMFWTVAETAKLWRHLSEREHTKPTVSQPMPPKPKFQPQTKPHE